MLIKTLLPVLGGFLLMGIIDQFTQCDTWNLDFLRPNEEVKIDMKAINSIADKTETAFLSGNVNEVKALLDEEVLPWYSEPLEKLSVEKLQAFGQALRSRELKAATPLLAEFDITENGVTYTITFWKGSEDSWKLLRF